MENKGRCWCGVLLGILVVVFAWWQVSWAPIALTVIGILVALCGILGKCCCEWFKKGRATNPSCCS